MPRYLPRSPGLGSPRRKPAPVPQRGDPLHDLVVGAAVVDHAERIAVGHRRFRHQIAPPQLQPVEPALPRREIDQPFHDVDDLRPPRAAIGAGRQGVGNRRTGAEMHGRHVIDARHDLDALGERPEGDRVGADIADIGAAHREEMALAVERELGFDRQIPRLVVAEKGFLALAGPFDRAADPARRPGDQREFGIERAARPEIAADLVHDDTHLVLGDAEDLRQLLLRPHGAADPGVQGVFAGVAVVGAGRGARLHRDTGDARHPGLELYDVSRLGKCGPGGGFVADFGIDGDVVGGVASREGSARRHSRHRVNYRRQGLVIHLYEFGGILCRSERRRHDHGDDLAAMTRLLRRHREMRRDERRRAVLVRERDVGGMPRPDRMRYRLQTIGRQVAPGQHGEHTGRPCCRCRVDRTNERVRMRRSHHHRISLAGEAEIVAVAAFAGQQPEILPAPHRLPDPGAVRACPHQSLSRCLGPLCTITELRGNRGEAIWSI